MRQFYLLYENIATVSQELSWSHYCELLSIQDFNKINYYINISIEQNLSVRDLRNKVKLNEYERLDDKTKIKLVSKEESNVEDIKSGKIVFNNEILNIDSKDIKEFSSIFDDGSIELFALSTDNKLYYANCSTDENGEYKTEYSEIGYSGNIEYIGAVNGYSKDSSILFAKISGQYYWYNYETKKLENVFETYYTYLRLGSLEIGNGFIILNSKNEISYNDYNNNYKETSLKYDDKTIITKYLLSVNDEFLIIFDENKNVYKYDGMYIMYLVTYTSINKKIIEDNTVDRTGPNFESEGDLCNNNIK